MITIKISYNNSMHTETLNVHSYHINHHELVLTHLIDDELINEYITLDDIQFEIINDPDDK